MGKFKKCFFCLRSLVIGCKRATITTVALLIFTMISGWYFWEVAISQIIKDCALKIPNHNGIQYIHVDKNDKVNTTLSESLYVKQNNSNLSILTSDLYQDTTSQETSDLKENNEHISFLEKMFCNAKSSLWSGICVVLIMIAFVLCIGFYLGLCFL